MAKDQQSCKGPVPERVVAACDNLAPNQRNPEDRFGRPELVNARGEMFVGTFGGPVGWPSQAPARADYTPGMPGEGKPDGKKKKDEGDATIHFGIRRP